MKNQAYSINSADVCVPGFERWRRGDEFMLSVALSAEMNKEDIRSQLSCEVSRSDRFRHFHYDSARVAINAFCDGLKEGDNPFDVDQPEDLTAEDWEYPHLFLYIQEPSEEQLENLDKLWDARQKADIPYKQAWSARELARNEEKAGRLSFGDFMVFDKLVGLLLSDWEKADKAYRDALPCPAEVSE